MFFFSSRRRHTRLTCDWSSDVCSSDLWCCPETAPLSCDLRVHPRGLPLRWLGNWGRSGFSRLRSDAHTSELQSHVNLVCRLLLEKKKINIIIFLLSITVDSSSYVEILL